MLIRDCPFFFINYYSSIIKHQNKGLSLFLNFLNFDSPVILNRGTVLVVKFNNQPSLRLASCEFLTWDLPQNQRFWAKASKDRPPCDYMDIFSYNLDYFGAGKGTWTPTQNCTCFWDMPVCQFQHSYPFSIKMIW